MHHFFNLLHDIYFGNLTSWAASQFVHIVNIVTHTQRGTLITSLPLYHDHLRLTLVSFSNTFPVVEGPMYLSLWQLSCQFPFMEPFSDIYSWYLQILCSCVVISKLRISGPSVSQYPYSQIALVRYSCNLLALSTTLTVRSRVTELANHPTNRCMMHT